MYDLQTIKRLNNERCRQADAAREAYEAEILRLRNRITAIQAGIQA